MSSGVVKETEDLLYQALSNGNGLLLEVSDPQLFAARIAAAKRLKQDPALARVKMKMSPFAGGNVILFVEPSPEDNSSQKTAEKSNLLEGPDLDE